MLITDGGLVPKGNPDRIEGTAATRWGSYNIEGSDDLRGEDYEVSHGGYDTRFVQEDPDRLVPLDAMREMEKTASSANCMTNSFPPAADPIPCRTHAASAER